MTTGTYEYQSDFARRYFSTWIGRAATARSIEDLFG